MLDAFREKVNRDGTDTRPDAGRPPVPNLSGPGTVPGAVREDPAGVTVDLGTHPVVNGKPDWGAILDAGREAKTPVTAHWDGPDDWEAVSTQGGRNANPVSVTKIQPDEPDELEMIS